MYGSAWERVKKISRVVEGPISLISLCKVETTSKMVNILKINIALVPTLHNDMLIIKKKLDLLSLMIEFCNKHRADIQRISEEYELTFVLFIPVLDAPDLVRILRLGELSIHTSHSVG